MSASENNSFVRQHSIVDIYRDNMDYILASDLLLKSSLSKVPKELFREALLRHIGDNLGQGYFDKHYEKIHASEAETKEEEKQTEKSSEQTFHFEATTLTKALKSSSSFSRNQQQTSSKPKPAKTPKANSYHHKAPSPIKTSLSQKATALDRDLSEVIFRLE